MKKLARLMALVLVLVMALSLSACGGLASKIKGEWEGTVEAEGMKMEVTLDFDDKEEEVTVEMSIMGQSTKETSDYEIDGDKLIIDGEEVDYEFDGRNKLTIENEDVTFELERVK